jgi:hypothetical protein
MGRMIGELLDFTRTRAGMALPIDVARCEPMQAVLEAMQAVL